MNTPVMNEKRTALAVLLCGFLITLGIGLFSFTVPLMSLDAKISGMWLGTGFAGFFLARLLVGPVGGWWADKVTPRVPLMAGSALAAITPFLYWFSPSVSSLLIIQFILGISAGLIRPVILSVVGMLSQRAVSDGFSRYVAITNWAMFAGPLVGGFLYWQRAMAPVLLGLSVCLLLFFLVVLLFIPCSFGTRPITEETAEGQLDGKGFIALLIGLFGRSLGIGLFIAFYPLLLAVKQGHVGPEIWLLFSLPSLVVCLGVTMVQKLVEKFPTAQVVIWGMLVSVGGLFLIALADSDIHFVGAGIVLGLGTCLSFPSSMKLTSRAALGGGKAFGTAHLANGLGLAIGPLLGGGVLQLFHDLSLPFFLVGVMGFMSSLPFLLWKERPDKGHYGPASKYFSWFVGSILVVGAVFFMFESNSEIRLKEDQLYRYSDVAMGTVVHLTLEADSQTAADTAARKAIPFMRVLQQDYDFRSVSGSIGEINRAAGRYWVTPSRRSFALLKRTLAFSGATGGVFDPTVGAATTSPLYFALDKSLLEAKKNLVDYRLVMLDEEGGRVRLTKPGMALDLGGVAKGTIIDATVALLRKQGVRAGIVEAGGDFYCFGDRDWTIGIRHPRSDKVYATVIVREQGVCGSGDYEQFVLEGQAGSEKVLHHILNPLDMAPAEAAIGVTVLAPSAEEADRLATTLFIMGVGGGQPFLAEHVPDVAAMWFQPDLSVVTTQNFPD